MPDTLSCRRKAVAGLSVLSCTVLGDIARLSLKQATKFHKYSVCSRMVSGATVAALVLTWPEVRRALREG